MIKSAVSKGNPLDDHGNQLPPAVFDHGNIDQTQIFHERNPIYASRKSPTNPLCPIIGRFRASTPLPGSNTPLSTGICQLSQETAGQRRSSPASDPGDQAKPQVRGMITS